MQKIYKLIHLNCKDNADNEYIENILGEKDLLINVTDEIMTISDANENKILYINKVTNYIITKTGINVKLIDDSELRFSAWGKDMFEIVKTSAQKVKISDNKQTLIQDSIEYLHHMIAAMELIRNGYSESYVCARYDIDKSLFRRLIAEPRLGYTTSLDLDLSDEETLSRIADEFYSWQERLCAHLLGKNVGRIDMPEDINETIDAVLDTLSENEKFVIINVFKDRQSYTEIGEKINYSRSNVNNIFDTAIKKLQHPSRMNRIRYGDKLYNEVEELVKIERQKRDDLRRKELYERRRIRMGTKPPAQKYDPDSIDLLKLSVKSMTICIQNGCDKISKLKTKTFREIRHMEGIDLESLNEIIEKLENFNASDPNDYAAKFESETDIPLENTNLTLRTYNCCIRSGYKNVNDFRNKTLADLKAIPKINEKSINEIIDMMREYDIII